MSFLEQAAQQLADAVMRDLDRGIVEKVVSGCRPENSIGFKPESQGGYIVPMDLVEGVTRISDPLNGCNKEQKNMNTAIYKYELEVVGLTEVITSARATPLSVGYQGTELVVWMTVDPECKEKRAIIFKSCFTGAGNAPQMNGRKYIGTAQRDDGIATHVFMV